MFCMISLNIHSVVYIKTSHSKAHSEMATTATSFNYHYFLIIPEATVISIKSFRNRASLEKTETC